MLIPHHLGEVSERVAINRKCYTRFAIELRLISIVRLNRNPLWNGALIPPISSIGYRWQLQKTPPFPGFLGKYSRDYGQKIPPFPRKENAHAAPYIRAWGGGGRDYATVTLLRNQTFCPVRALNACKISRNGVRTWLPRGRYGVSRGCYGVYVTLTGRLSSTPRSNHEHPRIATRKPRPTPFREKKKSLRGSYGTVIREGVNAVLNASIMNWPVTRKLVFIYRSREPLNNEKWHSVRAENKSVL